MKLYQYAVILHPTDAEKKRGERSKLLVPVTSYLAKDEQEVRIIAARAVPDEHVDKTDRLEVAVRPF